jgi:hypothetical protein
MKTWFISKVILFQKTFEFKKIISFAMDKGENTLQGHPLGHLLGLILLFIQYNCSKSMVHLFLVEYQFWFLGPTVISFTN